MAAGAGGRLSPTPSAIMVPWLKPTSASDRAGRLCRLSSASRKASSAGLACLTPRTSSLASRKGRLKHRPPAPPPPSSPPAGGGGGPRADAREIHRSARGGGGGVKRQTLRLRLTPL